VGQIITVSDGAGQSVTVSKRVWPNHQGTVVVVVAAVVDGRTSAHARSWTMLAQDGGISRYFWLFLQYTGMNVTGHIKI
jgi:hypothetical protein